jgi:hypothetical protein
MFFKNSCSFTFYENIKLSTLCIPFYFFIYEMILDEQEFLKTCQVKMGKQCRVYNTSRLEPFRGKEMTEIQLLELFPEICQIGTLSAACRIYQVTIVILNGKLCFPPFSIPKYV